MRKQILACLLTAFGFGWGPSAASGQETVRIGLIVPLTGGQASTGKQLDNAVKLYMRQHGDIVAGKRIEVIVRDDGAIPDNTKRIAQELIVNDKVQIIAGFGITPAALRRRRWRRRPKFPEIVMLAGASIVTERSPISSGPVSRWRSPPSSSATGRQRTASGRSRH
jgi:branched-chain amino acid transport system substrate-binding protein